MDVPAERFEEPLGSGSDGGEESADEEEDEYLNLLSSIMDEAQAAGGGIREGGHFVDTISSLPPDLWDTCDFPRQQQSCRGSAMSVIDPSWAPDYHLGLPTASLIA